MDMMDMQELGKKNKAELISIVEKLNSENLVLVSEIRFANARATALSKIDNLSAIEEYLQSILFGVSIKPTSSLRLVLEGKDLFGASVSEGIGPNHEVFHYLDDQVGDQLGGKSVLIIEDTSRIHNLLFHPGKIYPRSIYAFPIIFSEKRVGFIWVADEQINAYNYQDLSSMKSIAGEFEWALGFLVDYLRKTQAESIYSAAMNALDNPVIFCDASGEIVFYNRSARREFGLDQAAEERGTEIAGLIESLKQLPKNVDLQVKTNNFQGSKSLVTIPNHENNYLYRFENCTQAKLRSRYLSAIIDAISMEVTGGLDAIEGYASLISSLGELSPKQISYLDGIADESKRVSLRTRGLLDVNRLNTNEFLTIGSVNITEFIREITQKFQPVLTQKQLKVRLEFEVEPVCIESDADLIEQLILNLFESATQDAKMGSEIIVNLLSNGIGITLSVEDKSSGLSKPDIDSIFMDKAGVAGSRKNLYNAFIIVELLLGTIDIESQLGVGKKVNISFKHNI